MLDNRNRLKKDKDFKKIFSLSRNVVAGRLFFRVLKGKAPFVRFGFVISNKIDKRSTRRNAIKRRLRAISRQHLDKILPGHDIIIIVRERYPSPCDISLMNKDFQTGIESLKVYK